MGKAQPFAPISEGGLTELVGINELVATNQFSGSVAVALSAGLGISHQVSGTIKDLVLFETEDGTGGLLDPAGKLIILDADPAVSAGDAALTAAEWTTVVGVVDVQASDWVKDANGGVAYKNDVNIRFHNVTSLWFVFLLTSATSINSLAADDEQIEFNFEYRRES